jgi:CYTH domain-containing protein
MTETVEIERRFLVKSTPDGITTVEGTVIRQGYFFAEPDGPLHRIRQKGDRYYYTVKTGTGLMRTERERELAEEEFHEYWSSTEGKRLSKTRYHISLGDHTAELDTYHDELDGFRIVEVEFLSLQASEEFAPPPWFGPEVTTREDFTNAAFAIRGIPEDYRTLIAAAM